ncbi:hypothetical protein BFJ71_g16719 [Fusarium oxysporum]|nr:hypothetical protein BFJ71_g16719 [Fusarium oxysporum]
MRFKLFEPGLLRKETIGLGTNFWGREAPVHPPFSFGAVARLNKTKLNDYQRACLFVQADRIQGNLGQGRELVKGLDDRLGANGIWIKGVPGGVGDRVVILEVPLRGNRRV